MCLVDITRWRNETGLRQDVLLKALGKKKKQLAILDATAGFGHDALRMAAAGHHVTALERDPVNLFFVHYLSNLLMSLNQCLVRGVCAPDSDLRPTLKDLGTLDRPRGGSHSFTFLTRIHSLRSYTDMAPGNCS